VTVPFTVPITLAKRVVTSTDAYGNDVYTETTSTVQGVFAPGVSMENTQGEDQVVSQPTAYLPASVDPSAVDVLEVGGLRYQIDGEPQVWGAHPFTGWRPPLPMIVPLRRVTG
jgi:hypothetical protein